MKIRKPPTNDQLERIARQHLSWEALCLLDSLGYRGKGTVFNRAIGVLFSYRQNSRRWFNHPLGMHDMAIHTRVIADFLLCPSGCTNSMHRDDIEAGDYINNWQGIDVLGSNRESFNKSVAHLSRTRSSRSVMPVATRRQLGQKTLEGLKQFTARVPKEYAEWFGDLRKALEEIPSS